MRPVDRILRREAAPRPRFAVRNFGTTAAEAQATDSAAAAASGPGGTTTNLTTGDSRVRDVGDFDRNDLR